MNDLAAGAHNYASAPAKYLGDWSMLTPTDTLSVDIYFENTSNKEPSLDHSIFTLDGPGGRATALLVTESENYPLHGAWTTYSVTLDPTQWTLSPGSSWELLIENVMVLTISAEFVVGFETVYLDNVHLSGAPTSVTNDCVAETFSEEGTAEWSFQGVGGAINPMKGGNSGGYMQIAGESESDGYIIVPSKYLGDWSASKTRAHPTGPGTDTPTPDAATGSPEFIRISGRRLGLRVPRPV